MYIVYGIFIETLRAIFVRIKIIIKNYNNKESTPYICEYRVFVM